MKLKFTIHEPGSFFHFLDSISLWDIHTRKEIKMYYENLFSLTGKDEHLLKDYIKIRKKYPWKKLDSDFYPSRNMQQVLINLRKRLNKNEYDKLEEIINNFNPNIHKIFLQWKKALIKRKQSLEKEVKKHNLKELFSDIAKFYGSKNYPTEVFVHLVINPSNHSRGGGANIEPRNQITLEPTNLKEIRQGAVLNDVSIIAHETLHIIEHKANRNKWGKFMSDIQKRKLNESILREAIADTLVPGGYLALKYKLIDEIKIVKFNRLRAISKYKESKPSRYYRRSRQKLSAMLYPLTENQMKMRMTLFEGDYIKKSIEKYILMRNKT